MTPLKRQAPSLFGASSRGNARLSYHRLRRHGLRSRGREGLSLRHAASQEFTEAVANDELVHTVKLMARKNEKAKAAGAAAIGAAAGYGTVAASGMTAVGVIGSGAGFGAALGPIGAAAGAVLGLAGYGVYRVFKG